MKSYYSFLRRLVQLAFLAIFLWLLAKAAWPLAQLPADIFLRSDPLLTLAIPLAAREFAAKLLPGLLIIVSAAILGRFFCGFICPMGTTLDLAHFFFGRKGAGAKAAPKHWTRQIKYALLAFILAAAALGLNYSFWAAPIPLVTRFYALLLHPSILWSADAAATWLPDWFPAFEGLRDISLTPRIYDGFLLQLIFFLALFWLERRSPRFWCRNLCPAGAILSLAARLPLWRRRARNCVSCGLCANKCPAGAISADGLSSRHGECLTCQRCVDLCPARAVFFWPRPAPLPLKILEAPPPSLRMSRRAFLGGAALGCGLAFLHGPGRAFLPENAARALASPLLVRPPGSGTEEAFLALCARCGECVKACPTGGLQPVWPGPASLLSPALVARKGPCEPECNACGQVCPTGAVRPLSMPEKRWAKMGTAVVTRETCIAWAENKSCVVCQEVCPYGAVELQVTPDSRGIPTPVVRDDFCLGCGYCEFHCPVPQPAIVLTPSGALRLDHSQDYQKEARERGLSLDPDERLMEEPPADALPPGFLE